MDMTVATKTYVRYFMPRIFMPKEGTHEVSERNPYKIAKKLPESAFAFEFYDKLITIVRVNESGDREALTSGERNKSGRFYIDPEKLTVKDVEALPGDHSILLASMRCNNWPVILRCRTGNFQPLNPRDSIIALRDGE